jgi:hypothetical protein
MKTMTNEQFMSFCTFYDDYPEEYIRKITGGKTKPSALDILALREVPHEDRLRAVLHEELIDAPTLHEFGCLVAERAFSRIENPDPASIAVVSAKRQWMRDETTGEELAAARTAARAACVALDAAYAAYAELEIAWDEAWDEARDDARSAAYAAWAARAAAEPDARDAARKAAWYAGFVAESAARAAARKTARDTRSAAERARTEEHEEQIAMLRKMIEGKTTHETDKRTTDDIYALTLTICDAVNKRRMTEHSDTFTGARASIENEGKIVVRAKDPGGPDFEITVSAREDDE